MNKADPIYAERNKLNFMIYKLPLRDLARLNAVLAQLSEENLRRVAAFAEGLAMWTLEEPTRENDATSQAQNG